MGRLKRTSITHRTSREHGICNERATSKVSSINGVNDDYSGVSVALDSDDTRAEGMLDGSYVEERNGIPDKDPTGNIARDVSDTVGGVHSHISASDTASEVGYESTK
ncbi:hypothetical protein SARC_10249 [Sphaeroforma arctica JP610]|uniref:Uncharacterized protein n=1 Tax=Sphaeroforma arctica JP610 TaxID=667725 RepID=A0A0L0FKJ4_9EUKA|nr:hypothetical protein SARC_10249 [Sphaeroforma arctica JP610]KNC77285.1 hypothetical protein SARC_10249 [Sphaeroforma arctica JP610]|eukprot:XP_014151187.1 hypothetical protein SARC_10249 [Sphaeroforma arctica JP610]